MHSIPVVTSEHYQEASSTFEVTGYQHHDLERAGMYGVELHVEGLEKIWVGELEIIAGEPAMLRYEGNVDFDNLFPRTPVLNEVTSKPITFALYDAANNVCRLEGTGAWGVRCEVSPDSDARGITVAREASWTIAAGESGKVSVPPIRLNVPKGAGVGSLTLSFSACREDRTPFRGLGEAGVVKSTAILFSDGTAQNAEAAQENQLQNRRHEIEKRVAQFRKQRTDLQRNVSAEEKTQSDLRRKMEAARQK